MAADDGKKGLNLSFPSPGEFFGNPNRDGAPGGGAGRAEPSGSAPAGEEPRAAREGDDPPGDGRRLDPEFVRDFFRADGPLAVKPGYRLRPGQADMAAAVARVVNRPGILVVEAGTGVGKTFGYLVPILLSGKKALIATYSKALQDQLYDKDIAFLGGILGRDVKIALLKGAANYVCVRNLRSVFGLPGGEGEDEDGAGSGQTGLFDALPPGEARGSLPGLADAGKISAAVADYLARFGKSGEIDEFRAFMRMRGADVGSFGPQALVVKKLTCPKKKCPFYENGCFFVKNRKNAKEADVVVVNQSLLCYGVQTEETLFPKAPVVVVDEAHKFESVLRDAFSREVSDESLGDLLAEVEKSEVFRAPRGRRTRAGSGAADGDAAGRTAELRDRLREALTDLENFIGPRGTGSFRACLDNRYTDGNFRLRKEFAKYVYSISTFALPAGAGGSAPAGIEAAEEGSVADLAPDRLLEGLARLRDKIAAAAARFGELVRAAAAAAPDEDRAARLREAAEPILAEFDASCGFLDEIAEYADLCLRAGGIPAEGAYFWYRLDPRHFRLIATPFKPDLAFRQFFLDPDKGYESFVFTSATIGSAGPAAPGAPPDFSDFTTAVGVADAAPVCKRVPSPFDLKRNALLCVPRELERFAPGGAEARPGVGYATPANIVKMLEPVIAATAGGIFFLTTSFESCRRYAEAFRASARKGGAAAGRTILVQERGGGDNARLLETFRKAGDAVLVGTKSFWEGVDIPGSALSLVIIEKIPFPMKCVHNFMSEKRCESEGCNGFDRVDVAAAVIDLKQGAGRLIRTETDRGAVIVLARELLPDSPKRYMRRIISNLAHFGVTTSLDDVRAFMAGEAPRGGTENL